MAFIRSFYRTNNMLRSVYTSIEKKTVDNVKPSALLSVCRNAQDTKDENDWLSTMALIHAHNGNMPHQQHNKKPEDKQKLEIKLDKTEQEFEDNMSNKLIYGSS